VPAAPTANSVIVVEDDSSMSQAMARMLRIAGFVPAMFTSAEELLENPELDGAMCFVIDIQLPGINGFSLRERLRAAGRDLPVVFITAFDDGDARQQAREGPSCAFLAKPFSGQTLIEAVRRVSGARGKVPS
jgi:FixJ family two-component response regulator